MIANGSELPDVWAAKSADPTSNAHVAICDFESVRISGGLHDAESAGGRRRPNP
jgi:hypothetical protein